MYTSPSLQLIDRAQIIKQGAEAKVYLLPTHIPEPDIYWPPSSSSTSAPLRTSSPVILKHRFPKGYRHPKLDAALTKSRLTFEARSLARCTRANVVVPGVRWVDETSGVLGMEYIDGWSVREVLGGGAEGEVEEEEEEVEDYEAKASTPENLQAENIQAESSGMAELKSLGVSQEHLMTSIGTALARLHLTTIIHGDLTTSNMMVRLTPESSELFEIVLIDFGLSSTATLPENYAVDLYVLERAFASTHPASEKLYAGVLEAYAAGLGEKKWKPIESKLKEVRLRGRKRDMTG